MSNKTPDIRFKDNNEDWEQDKLSMFVNIKSGWSPSNFNKSNSSKGEMFIKVDDLNYSSREQSNSKLKVTDNTRFEKMKMGSVIFPKRGAAIMTNKVRILANDAFMDTNMMALEPLNIDSSFLYTLIDRIGLYKIADTSTIPQINNKHIKPYKIMCPKFAEQKKIGSFYKKLDDNIALHQHALNLLKQSKKGFLQKMFPKKGENVPELRFSGYTEEWNRSKLGELASFLKGKGYKKGDIVDKGNPIILYGRLYTHYQTVIERVDTFVETEKGSVISDGKEVIVPASGETSEDISRAAVIADKGIIIGGDLNIIKPNSEIDSTFLAITISNGSQKKELTRRAQGKSVVHIRNSNLKNVNLIYPTIEEQTKIGNFLKELDDSIALREEKLETLKQMKKAFLQKMFV